MIDGDEKQNKPVRIFISYSHKDDGLRQKLLTFLAPLVFDEKIESWDDRMLGGGEEWHQEIQKNLESAEIILLLVTANFLASKFIREVEQSRALERQKAGEAVVIPIILRECLWQSSAFAYLQALPRDGKPAMSYTNKNIAFTEIAKAIGNVVEKIKNKRK